MALLRTDPFRDIDRLVQQVWGGPSRAVMAAPYSMPLDAYRKGDQFLVQIDLPGVRAEEVDVTVEDNVLTVRVERRAPELSGDVETLASERLFGTYSRQLFLGRNLDTSRIEARYEEGVLNLMIPIAEHAKARRIEVGTNGSSGPVEIRADQQQQPSVSA